MRRASLKRKTPLARCKPLAGGKPLKQMSDRRKKENASYTSLRKEFLDAHPKCDVCRVSQSTEVHHMGRRYGKWLCDIRFFLATCRTCHLKIENYGEWARSMGFLLTPEQRRLLEGP